MSTFNSLNTEQFDQIGQQFDAIRKEIVDDLGERDEQYIRGLVKRQRQMEIAGRIMMMLPPTWPLGVAALGTSKILDNMEIGHNVMHGQYDFMNDPILNSRDFDWDSADTARNWKITHNHEHHTYTNVLNKDHDIGYGLLRMSEEQKWEPRFLANLPLTVLLHTFFQHFVAVQNLKIEDYLIYKTKTAQQVKDDFKPMWKKMRKQLGKDYLLFPLLAGPLFPLVFVGNGIANLMRNVWACAVIFNGHFPEEVEQFSEESIENESRGQWYVRQLLGSANFSGGRLMHIMSGNLSFQIEHHLFPDLPAHRYAEIAPRVRAICEQHNLPYNTGPFLKQTLSTWTRIAKMSLPTRRKNKDGGDNAKNGGNPLPLAA
ncbi:MAG: fatty acid desaturase family protein [Oceanococcus sp.]